MKKAIFLVFLTVLGLFKPVFLGAMDSNNNFKKASVTTKLDEESAIIAELKTYILTYQLSKLAKEQLEAIKVIKEYTHLVKLFIRIITGMKVPDTPHKKQLDPVCKAMLLQCRPANPFKSLSEENIFAFSQKCVEIIKTFDHPLINKISRWIEARNKIPEISAKTRWLFSGNKGNVTTRPIRDYHTIYSNLYDKLGNVNTDLISDLQDWITIYDNNLKPFIGGFAYLVHQLPPEQEKQFKNAFMSHEELESFMERNLGAAWEELVPNSQDHKLINAAIKKNQEKIKNDFLPPGILAFDKRKKAKQKIQNKLTKNQRKKRSKKKKQSKAADLPPIEEKQEIVPTITSTINIIKSPQEPLTQKQLEQRQLQKQRIQKQQLIQRLESYYPEVEKIVLYPHMVQFTDTITKRRFTLYNATGNTNYQDPAQFTQLAKLPKIHWRVRRWNGDIDQAIVQVQNETGKKITRDARKDWIREHQLPVALLYYFRKMGHEKTFTDNDNNKITCLYFVGRLKDREYKRDGYFGLGFLPDEKKKKPTIYHACFEPKSFRAILAQDKELTAAQKKNLSLAFKSKDKKS